MHVEYLFFGNTWTWTNHRIVATQENRMCIPKVVARPTSLYQTIDFHHFTTLLSLSRALSLTVLAFLSLHTIMLSYSWESEVGKYSSTALCILYIKKSVQHEKPTKLTDFFLLFFRIVFQWTTIIWKMASSLLVVVSIDTFFSENILFWSSFLLS